jgi:hypothetical protein
VPLTRRRAEGVAIQQGGQVEAAAADDQREPASGADLGNQASCLACPGCDAERLVGCHQVDQVMRHRRTRSGIGLGRPDVHAAEHLARVGDQDLDRESCSQRQRELGLA